MEVGAITMLLYCLQERELLLNINELIAGFRLFPSYLRIGGLREDLPMGFHETVRAFLDRFPEKIDRFEKMLTKNDIWLRRTPRRRRADARRTRSPMAAWVRLHAPRVWPTTCAGRSRI